VLQTVVEVVDGVAVARQLEMQVEVPVYDEFPVVDERGAPVLEPDGARKVHRVQRTTKVPVETRRIKHETMRTGQRTHYGLLAQEVKAALDREGVDDFAGWVLGDKTDPGSTQGLRYDQFIAPLIKAVQELSRRVAALEGQPNP
jgi:hypothetical protein